MTADIHTARTVRLDHLQGLYLVGSGDWSWQEEYDDLMRREYTSMMTLILSIKSYGIQQPILLGGDGRVWDGHHRICAAIHLGIEHVPVEFPGSPESKNGVKS